MTDSNRRPIRTLRLLPAVLALSILLLALVPAETAVNWLRHQASQAPIVVAWLGKSGPEHEQQCMIEDPPFWVTRNALASSTPEVGLTAPEVGSHGRCIGENCFDAAGFDLANFEPSAGGVAPAPGAGGTPTELVANDSLDLGAEPPAIPSGEPVLVAALDTFTAENGVRQARGGEPGPGNDIGMDGGSGAASGGTKPGGTSDQTPMEYVLLPGTNLFNTSGTGSGGGGSTGGSSGTGGTPDDGQQGGSAPGGATGPGVFLLGASGGSGSGNGSGPGGTTGPSAVVGFGADPVEISSPAGASLLAAALATLMLRRRIGHA